MRRFVGSEARKGASLFLSVAQDKFQVKSALKGKGAQSGIRIIYAYYEAEDWIEFIEIYYKGDKESEGRERVLRKYPK